MSSMGRFETYIDLITHVSIYEYLKYTRLTGESDNPEYLEEYFNKLFLRYTKEQVIYLLNSNKFID